MQGTPLLYAGNTLSYHRKEILYLTLIYLKQSTNIS